MKNVWKILMVCFITLGCTSNDDNQLKSFCLVNDPVADLSWLKAEIDQREQNVDASSKYYYISQAIHENLDIIVYANCDPVANSVFLVFNCSGENIGFIGDGDFPFELLTNDRVIWKTDDFACDS